MSNKLMHAAVVFCLATAVRAEVQRPQYAVENRFPKVSQLETGVTVNYTENEGSGLAGDLETLGVAPYARYGLVENLTATARLPLLSQDADVGDTEYGLGSLALGLQLRAYQSALTYPFVVPHVEVQIDTADSDLSGPAGDTFTTFGISVGTVVEDDWTFVADGRYKVYQGDRDNVAEAAVSVLWAWSERFSWIGEVKISESDDTDGTPVGFLGGFSYDWTRQLSTSFHAGGGNNDAEDDVVAVAKVAYTW